MAKHTLDKKDKAILKLLKENPEGLRITSISKQTEIPTRTCYNHLEKLLSMKVIQNLYPIWKIWHSSDTQEIMAKLLDSDKNTEGHRIWWVLPLIKKPHWWDKRKDRLMRLKGWAFKKEVTAHNNIYFQIENDYMEIQTFKNSIYFIGKQKYKEATDFEVFEKAKNDVINAIKYLEERFRFKFLAENEFHLTLVDNHYVTMNETLAEHYYKQGKKFRIETKEGYSLWIDLSDPKGLESNNIETKRRYLKVVKDYQDNPLIPLPSELATNQAETGQGLKILTGAVSEQVKMVSGLPIILNKLEKQISSHLDLIKEYRKENIAWRKNTEKNIRKELKNKEQTKLGSWF